MDPASVPLTWSVALTHWRWDTGAGLAVIVLSLGYGWAWRRCPREALTTKHAWCFGVGIALLATATMSVIGVYDRTLFWVRALQVLLLLFVIPFFLAMGRPVTALRLDRAVATPVARVLFHPATTSVAMLATPWLLYLTPWYVTSLRNDAVAALTRVLLLLIGFGYFYARLQTDPVPRRYSQLISLVISIVESIGDGLLWIVGDVLGVAFIIVIMRFFSTDERKLATSVDAELDMAEASSGLWWESDPQLRDRMGHR